MTIKSLEQTIRLYLVFDLFLGLSNVPFVYYSHDILL